MEQCLGLLALLRGEPIDLGRLIAENIKYMDNATQRACGHFCVINELCRGVGVPVYPEVEMISPKAPLNVSAIRRLEHIHHIEASHHDPKVNQVRNHEGFIQPQVKQQQQVQGQQASEF